MLFDPFTMIAQLVNFAVLVVALKYLLYERVITAMDERQAKVARQLEEADERELEAAAAADSYRRQQQALEDQREELLRNAGHAAAERRKELVEQARADIDVQRNRWSQSLHRERQDLERELRRRVGVEVIDVSRRALSDLADANLERRALDKALEQLKDDHPTRTALFGASDGTEPPATVSVLLGFPGEIDREYLIGRLHELGLSDNQTVVVEHSPDAIFGVEMRSNGTSIQWNIGDYLDRLGIMVDELIEDGGSDASHNW